MKKYPINSSLSESLVKESEIIYGHSKKYSKLAVILGGENALDNPIKSEMDLIHISRVGLPKKTLDSLSLKLGISMERLSKLLHISHRTLQRKSSSDHLSAHVSEQILAMAEVIRKGLEVFGNEKNLEIWLHSAMPSLDYRKPIDLMDTTFGTRMLLRIFGRIEHGVY